MKKIVIALPVLLAPIMAEATDLPSKTSAPQAAEFYSPKIDAYFGGDIGYQATANTVELENFAVATPDARGGSFGFHGSLSIPISQQYGMQFDADFRRTSHQYNDLDCLVESCKVTSNSPSIAAHVFKRNPSFGMFGAFAQYSSATQLYLDSSSNEHVFAGLEGQYFLNDMTFYGQVAYVYAQPSVGSFAGDGVALTAQVRYFVDPNFMLAIRASYIDTKWSFGDLELYDYATSSIGARAELRLTNSPISIYGDISYSMGQTDFNEIVIPLKISMDETRFIIGLNLNFGGVSLLERDRSGASLNLIDAPHSPLGFTVKSK